MTGENGRTGSTCCQEDSPASLTVLPEEGLEKTILDISGRRCLAQFGRYVPNGSWARTFAALLVGMAGWSSRRCSLIWRLRDTKSSRSYFQLQVSVPRTAGSASGSLAAEDRTAGSLLPTPTTGSNRNSRNAVQKKGAAHQHHGLSLGLAQVAEISTGTLPKEFDSWKQVPGHYKGFLPTPTAVSDAKGGCTRSDPKRQNGSLAHAIHGILGTRGGTSPSQSPVCYGDDGLPAALDGITFPRWRTESIKAGGNAIVPQVAFQIFRAIQACHPFQHT